MKFDVIITLFSHFFGEREFTSSAAIKQVCLRIYDFRSIMRITLLCDVLSRYLYLFSQRIIYSCTKYISSLCAYL